MWGDLCNKMSPRGGTVSNSEKKGCAKIDFKGLLGTQNILNNFEI